MKKILLTLLLLISAADTFCQRLNATLTGDFSQLHDQDTVSLLVYKYGHFPYNVKELYSSYNAPVINKHFKLKISLADNRPYECRIMIPRLRITANIIIVEPGDRLHISGTDISINDLSGKGSEKTNILSKLNAIWNSSGLTASETAPSARGASGLEAIIDNCRAICDEANQYIESRGKNINTASKRLLHAYMLGPIWEINNTLYWFSSVGYSQEQRDSIQKIMKVSWLPFRNSYFYPLDPQSAMYDYHYAQNLIADYALKQIIENQNFNALNDNSDIRKKYVFFKSHYHGLLREKLLTLLILSAPKSNEVAYCYKDARQFIKNKDFKEALDAHCQSLPGSPAYNFTLLDSNKVIHRLSDFRGKVLVFDFWFTGCGNCRELTPKLKLVEERFKDDNRVQFISISSDKNIDLWKRSIRSGLYTTSPSEINLYTSGLGISDPLYKKTNTYSSPTLKLVDAKGNWCENPVDCRFDDGKDLIEKIEKALGD